MKTGFVDPWMKQNFLEALKMADKPITYNRRGR
jgi:hypothetical protein